MRVKVLNISNGSIAAEGHIESSPPIESAQPVVTRSVKVVKELGGLATGFPPPPHPTVLVAACDMPFLSAAVWRVLLRHAGEADVVIPRVGGEYETLHALYAKACVPAMARALAERRMRVISFFADVRVLAVEAPELRAVDPDLRAFTNVNTPEELATALGDPPPP